MSLWYRWKKKYILYLFIYPVVHFRTQHPAHIFWQLSCATISSFGFEVDWGWTLRPRAGKLWPSLVSEFNEINTKESSNSLKYPMRNRSLAAHKSMQKSYIVYSIHNIPNSDIERSIEVARCRTMQLWDMINCRVASQQTPEKSLLLRWHSAGDGSWYWTCTRQRFAEFHQNKNKVPSKKTQQ